MSSQSDRPVVGGESRPRRRRTLGGTAWDAVGVIGGIAGVLFALLALSFPTSPFMGAYLGFMGVGWALACTVLLVRRT